MGVASGCKKLHAMHTMWYSKRSVCPHILEILATPLNLTTVPAAKRVKKKKTFVEFVGTVRCRKYFATSLRSVCDGSRIPCEGLRQGLSGGITSRMSSSYTCSRYVHRARAS